MKNKYVFVVVMLGVILLAGMGLTNLYVVKTGAKEEEDKITVVTSFYPMYIAAENVIGDSDHIILKNLSEPQTGCLHDFQLTPEDMKLLSTADVFIVNGGGIESFMEEVASAYPKLKIIEACSNTELIQDEEEENAHAWMSVEAYEQQVETIAKELGEADHLNGKRYQDNAAIYIEKLEPLRERCNALASAAEGEHVILFHEAYAYVARDCGLEVSFVLDLDEERQVSAGEVSDVLAAVKRDDVRYILAEKRYGESMGETVEKDSGVKVIYLDPLNRGDYDADSYLEGMDGNLKLLEQSFGEKKEGGYTCVKLYPHVDCTASG